MEFKAFITNLGKYNEGELVGEWAEFPMTEDEFEEVLERIGIGSTDEFGQPYEEWFVTDYDCEISCGFGEYPSYEDMNSFAEAIQDADGNAVEAAMDLGYSAEEAVEKLENGDLIFLPDVYDEEDLGYTMIEWEYGGVENAPAEVLENHFDYAALGRDLGFDSYESDPKPTGEISLTISDIEVYNPETEEYELKDNITTTVDYNERFNADIQDYTDVDDDDIDTLAKELIKETYGIDDCSYSTDYDLIENDGYVTAGEYWCGDEYASDLEIGEAYVDEVGFDGVSNPEYYFDAESYGLNFTTGGAAWITGNGAIIDFS